METTENPSDAVASSADAAKWVVGLSTAVFAGVFLHPEQIVQRPEWERACFAFILLLFGISIICGILYLFWLNWGRRQREKRQEIDSDIAAEKVAASKDSAKVIEKLEKKRTEVQKNIVEAPGKTTPYYRGFIIFFCVAAGLGVLGFCGSIVWPLKSAAKPVTPVATTTPVQYVIAQSAVHKVKGGMQAHTFLLNQQTGDLWQMVCDMKGEVVSFRRVPRLDGKGNLEADVSKAVPSR